MDIDNIFLAESLSAFLTKKNVTASLSGQYPRSTQHTLHFFFFDWSNTHYIVLANDLEINVQVQTSKVLSKKKVQTSNETVKI